RIRLPAAVGILVVDETVAIVVQAVAADLHGAAGSIAAVATRTTGRAGVARSRAVRSRATRPGAARSRASGSGAPAACAARAGAARPRAPGSGAAGPTRGAASDRLGMAHAGAARVGRAGIRVVAVVVACAGSAARDGHIAADAAEADVGVAGFGAAGTVRCRVATPAVRDRLLRADATGARLGRAGVAGAIVVGGACRAARERLL